MQTSTSGFASASFCRIMAIRSLTLAAPGGCCGCLNMRGMKGLWVMPMIDTIWAMGHLLGLVVSCLARWLELCKRCSRWNYTRAKAQRSPGELCHFDRRGEIILRSLTFVRDDGLVRHFASLAP